MADCGPAAAASLINQQLVHGQAAAAAAAMMGGGAQHHGMMEAEAAAMEAEAAVAHHQHMLAQHHLMHHHHHHQHQHHHHAQHQCAGDWCHDFAHQHHHQHQHQLPWALAQQQAEQHAWAEAEAAHQMQHQQHMMMMQHNAAQLAAAAQLQGGAMAAQQQEWAQQFEHQQDAGAVFGIEGQGAPLSYEEKSALSDFNGLMQDLRSGRAEIVEGDDAVEKAAGRENDVADADFRDGMCADDDLAGGAVRPDYEEADLQRYIQQQQLVNANASVEQLTADFMRRHILLQQQQRMMMGAGAGAMATMGAGVGQVEDMDEAAFIRQFQEAQRRQQRQAGGEDDEDDMMMNDEEDWHQQMNGGGEEDWVKEYMSTTNRADAARENSEYPFEQNNPYMFHDNPFEEGINFLAAGVLSEAVLAFEAACQQAPDKLEAWQYLGTTQAENEKDGHAIIALNKARQLCPTHPAVLLALSACYTNEMMTDQAMSTLKAWLKCDPRFADLEEHLATAAASDHGAAAEAALAAARGESGDEGEYVKDYFFVDGAEHRKVCQLFEAAAEVDPLNVDVHVALGTLRHLGHDYLKAAAHFEAAVQLQPENEKLWNKLGATLANGQQSDKAIGAYQRALDINPGFVRAQYNLGIANSNLGRHRDAARHFVRAIMLQSGWTDASCDETDNSPARTTRDIWDVLRMSLGCLQRQDLVQLSWQHKLTPFVREFGCNPGGDDIGAGAGGAGGDLPSGGGGGGNNVQLVQELA